MKSSLLLCLALVTFSAAVSARGARIWSNAELMKASDLVVVARPIRTELLDETNLLGYDQTKSFHGFRGMVTTFKVLDILKGMPRNDRIILHHYREDLSPPNCPGFVTFRDGSTNEYFLYLVKDGPNRYAPVTGQIDPELSVKSPASLPAGDLDFPCYAPIAGANPSIRHPVRVSVPTRLEIERTAGTLSVTLDTNSFESTNLMVGTNMVTGVQSRLFVYPVGGTRPTNGVGGWFEGGGLVFDLGATQLHTKPDGIPQPGQRYVVEMDLAAFETDVPPQHMWSPFSEKYRIIWKRTFKQIVQ